MRAAAKALGHAAEREVLGVNRVLSAADRAAIDRHPVISVVTGSDEYSG
jgi:hypothetical protein